MDEFSEWSTIMKMIVDAGLNWGEVAEAIGDYKAKVDKRKSESVQCTLEPPAWERGHTAIVE